MIDIHTHIIPGIDDGAKTIEESIEIVKKAISEGVKTIIATPHVLEMPHQSMWQKVIDTFDNLRQRLIAEKITVEIILGAELFLTPDLPKTVKENKELTINGTGKYILLELPLQEMPSFTEQVLFDLLMCGIVPIITHPERYFEIWRDPNKLFNIVQKGALTHVNSGSLRGRYGKKAQKTAKTLLTHNLIHMIGSDVHSIFNGSYPLSHGVHIAAEVIGMHRAQAMVTSLPEKVINGEIVEVMPPKPIERNIFKKYFSR